MTAAVLLDHVAAYAAAVREALADLPQEQVEDLTDGLEADLAEALEDPHGAVSTGEVPVVVAVVDGGVLIDLTRRFGPAAAYAAELRAAAGLGAPAPRSRREGPVRERLRGARRALRAAGAAAVAPALRTPAGAWLLGLARSLRPVGWLVRGWVWWVLALSATNAHELTEGLTMGRFVPVNLLAWASLAAVALLSVSLGRGWAAERRGVRPALTVATVVAVVAAPFVWLTAVSTLSRAVAAGPYPVYYEAPVERRMPPEDGVVVDGQQVSNLFVYDAQGNPLTGVQIFDDRGRQVRTTQDEGWGEWWLPGLDQPWSFAAAHDADGRVRWNVYPLAGAPTSAWTFSDDGQDRVLVEGQQLRTPPAPFLRAPALAVPGTTASGVEEGAAAGTEGAGAEASGASTPSPAP